MVRESAKRRHPTFAPMCGFWYGVPPAMVDTPDLVVGLVAVASADSHLPTTCGSR
jgi:hypothetical protein